MMKSMPREKLLSASRSPLDLQAGPAMTLRVCRCFSRVGVAESAGCGMAASGWLKFAGRGFPAVHRFLQRPAKLRKRILQLEAVIFSSMRRKLWVRRGWRSVPAISSMIREILSISMAPR
jgi:hypothetical protein